MAIQADNLKFRRASVMANTPTNGGLPSSIEIVDGASNQIFDDVSELNRAAGAAEFRKVFAWIDEDGLSVGRGANIVISEPASDANTSVVLFAAGSVGETQAQMLARVQAAGGSISTGTSNPIEPDIRLAEPPLLAGGIALAYNNLEDVHGSDAEVGVHGGLRFVCTQAVRDAAASKFGIGDRVTLMTIASGSIVRLESLAIAKVYRSVSGSGSWFVAFEFSPLSAYAYSSWVSSSVYYNNADVSHPAQGTYLAKGDVPFASKFPFYGASRLSSSVAADTRVLTVDAVRVGVVPAGLATSPEAVNILGFDPGILSKNTDGKEAIFQVGRFVVVGKDIVNGPSARTPGTVSLGETMLKRVKLIGADGARITTGWSANLDTGVVTITSVSGWSQPVKIIGRGEDMAMISAIAGNQLTIGRDLTRDYPAGSAVSTALVVGDIQAKVTALFDQSTWSGVWSDAVDGSGVTSAEFNASAYPVALTNRGAITERWRVVFTSSSSFVVIGEHVGQVAVGDTSHDCAPVNPVTGTPYFTLPALAWGSGWSVGNVLRINTEGAVPPVWLLRCVQQSPDTLDSDQFALALRLGVNRP